MAPKFQAMNERLFAFVGGNQGRWKVLKMKTLLGPALEAVERIDVVSGPGVNVEAKWRLLGVTSHERYVTRPEKTDLVTRQEGLGREASTCAALIPIRKSAAWWAMTQDERRVVFEESSRHIQIGMQYLPAIARRLHHCRDLEIQQPFDFLTWFEFAPADTKAFDDLLAALRATPEWAYVDGECEIRLERDLA